MKNVFNIFYLLVNGRTEFPYKSKYIHFFFCDNSNSILLNQSVVGRLSIGSAIIHYRTMQQLNMIKIKTACVA